MAETENTTTMEKMILRRAAGMQRPVSGTLELLPLCNMNCDMCYIRMDRREMEKRGTMHTADEWISLCEDMKEEGILFLLLTGGEPLLFPDFRKLYTALKKMGMVLTVNTNGTLLDEEWADFFAKYPPRRINITLYGTDEKTYQDLCHYTGFEKALNAVRLLRDRNIDVKMNGSATKVNKDQMEELYKIAEELQVPIHVDTYMIPGIRDRNLPIEQQSRLNPEDAAEAELLVLKHEMSEKEYSDYKRYILKQVESSTAYNKGISCMAGNCAFQIDWKGEMHPCLSLTQPAVKVFEEGFKRSWERISTEAKKLHLNEKCGTCRLRPVCKTCVASAYLETGKYDGVSEYLCKMAEHMVKLLREE